MVGTWRTRPTEKTGTIGIGKAGHARIIQTGGYIENDGDKHRAKRKGKKTGGKVYHDAYRQRKIRRR